VSRFQIESRFGETAERGETSQSFSPFQIELADIQASALREAMSKDNTTKGADGPADVVAAKTPPRTAADLLKDVTEKFDKATDKTQAMKDLREQFNEAIKKSDEELESANPDPAVETLRAREHFKKALKQLETAFPKR